MLKVVNASSKPQTYTIDLEGVGLMFMGPAVQQVLTATDKGDFNTLDHPDVVKPVEKKIKWNKVVLAGNSLNVIVIGYKFK
jgi:alpha-L-arabinofuranosidase